MAENKIKKQLKREDVDKNYTWDTSKIFKTGQDFEDELKSLEKILPELTVYEGRLAESGQVIAEFLTKQMNFDERINKLYTYAHLLSDQDTGNSENQARYARTVQFLSEVEAKLSFFTPELLAIGFEKIAKFISEEPKLALYKQFLQNKMRFAEHTLSAKEERILAAAEPVLAGGATIFSSLNNADITFEPFLDEQGQEIEVTHSSYARLIQDSNRQIREGAFKSIHNGYKKLIHTFAATLNNHTKFHNLDANLRNYSSARASAVFTNNIPEEVQVNLIETINANLSLLHDYVRMRKEKMGVDKLYQYDLYPSMVEDIDMNFTIEEAVEIVQEALKPLGEEYLERLRKAFAEKWIDWVDNKGKRSGAYSSGCYGTNPYILMSWQGTLGNVYTLIHELGHSMHSYLTWENQPYPYANYCIFLAEIASTTNENLLTHYFLEKYTDPQMRAYILNNHLDRVKSTMFRQTQFAEFEHAIHVADQQGIALTADYMCKVYGEINQKYYGESLEPLEEITYEWARIPHFYYNYYVYQYATGFATANAFATAIFKDGESAVNKYLGFLKSGSSKYPIETLKEAGVDMLRPEPIENTLAVFKSYMEELKV